MENQKRDKVTKKEFGEKNVVKDYDEGKDNEPLRDTFRNVLDSNLTGKPEERE